MTDHHQYHLCIVTDPVSMISRDLVPLIHTIMCLLSFSRFASLVLQDILPGSLFSVILLLFPLHACFPALVVILVTLCLCWGVSSVFLVSSLCHRPCECCRDMEAMFVYIRLVMWWCSSVLVRFELSLCPLRRCKPIALWWHGVSSLCKSILVSTAQVESECFA